MTTAISETKEEKQRFDSLEHIVRNELSDVHMLDTIQFPSVPVWFPREYVVKRLGFGEFGFNTNYRIPSMSGLKELVKSITTTGLLELPVLNIQKEDNSIRLFDGRRRTIAMLLAGYEELPFEAYSVSKDKEASLELSLNATKTKIPIYDVARAAKDIYDVFSMMAKTESDNKPISLQELSHILNRKPETISNYLSFFDLHGTIQNYVECHDSLKLFSRAVKIAKSFPEKKDQLQFFKTYKDEMETSFERYKKQHTKGILQGQKKSIWDFRLSEKEFNMRLKKSKLELELYKQKELKQEITLQLSSYVMNKKNTFLHQIQREAKESISYLETLSKLIWLDDDLLASFNTKTSVLSKIDAVDNSFINVFQERLNHIRLKLDERIHDNSSLRQRLELPFTITLEDRLASLLRKKNGQEKGRPLLLATVPKFYSVDTIEPNLDNIRKQRSQETIDALRTDIKEHGQIKAGAIYKPEKQNGSKPYRIVFGDTRFEAVKQEGIQYFKAFLIEHPSPEFVKILQSVEDLYEADTLYERALKIQSLYQLKKQIHEQKKEAYTEENFLDEHKHLANKKTLDMALDVFSLSDLSQYALREGILSYKATQQFEQISKPEQVDVLINTVRKKWSEKKVLDYITTLKQPTLFSTQSMKSFNSLLTRLDTICSCVEQRIQQSQQVSQIKQQQNFLKEQIAVYKELKHIHELVTTYV